MSSGSSIYQRFGAGSQGGAASAMQAAAQVLAGRDPQVAFQSLMQGNPAFARFVADNRGKAPEQIAREHGVDLGQAVTMVQRLMGGR